MNTVIKDLAASSIEAFYSQLRGKIVMPSDTSYDLERKVYNGMISKHPGILQKLNNATSGYPFESYIRAIANFTVRTTIDDQTQDHITDY